MHEPTYCGFEVITDYKMHQGEIHMISTDGAILGTVFNLDTDPNRGVEHDKLDDKIEHHFKYHGPTQEQIPIYNEIRDAGKVFAKIIAKHAPLCADLDAAISHVEDAC